MIVTREDIIRMTRSNGSGGSGGSSGGGGNVGITMNQVWGAMAGETDEQINLSHMTAAQTWANNRFLQLTGGTINGNLNVSGNLNVGGQLRMGGNLVATQTWVGQNYLSIAFFRQLFRAYKPATTSGDPDVEVAPNTLSNDITNIKAMFGFWTQQYISALGNNPGGGGGGGGGGASSLSELTDVTITSPTGGQVLTFDQSQGSWVNATLNMLTMSDVWTALGTSGNDQIDASHLSTALTGYATQTWVSNNYLGINATAQAAVKLMNARSIWGQSFDGTANIKGTLYMLSDENGATINTDSAKLKFSSLNTDASHNYRSPYIQAVVNGLSGVSYGRKRLGFFTSNATNYTDEFVEAVSLLPNGNVGIGDTAPDKKLKVVGTFSASGAATLGNTLSVTSNATVGGTLGVTGATTLSSTLGVSGVTTLSNTLSVTGATTLNSTLSVSGNTTIGGTLQVTGKLTANGGITIPSGQVLKIGSAELSWDSANQAIKITKGFYSETFISALGAGSSGGGGGGASALSELTDVTLTSPANGNLLQFNGSKWVNKTVASVMTDYVAFSTSRNANTVLAAPNGSNGSASFRHLQSADVYTNSATGDITNDGMEFLTSYQSETGFANETYGNRIYRRPISALWAYINGKASSVYATKSSVETLQGYFTSGSAKTAIALKNTRTLWGQDFNGTANVSGNMTDVGTISASGNITVTKSDATAASVIATNTNGSIKLHTATNRGVYDDTNSKWLIATNGTNTWLNCGNVAIDASSNTDYKLWVNGTLGTADDITIPNGYHYNVKDSGGTSRNVLYLSATDNLHLGYATAGAGYNTYISGNNVSLRYGTSRTTGLYLNSSGNVGIGTTSPAHTLHVVGGIYATTYVAALSDERKKDVKGDITLTVDQVAKAPAVKFGWKDKKNPGVFVGSLAQYWQEAMPEVVQDHDGTLSLDYQVTALMSSIVTARKVVNHEERIKQLEHENQELRKRLNMN